MCVGGGGGGEVLDLIMFGYNMCVWGGGEKDWISSCLDIICVCGGGGGGEKYWISSLCVCVGGRWI